jgi:hypothetical protein
MSSDAQGAHPSHFRASRKSKSVATAYAWKGNATRKGSDLGHANGGNV